MIQSLQKTLASQYYCTVADAVAHRRDRRVHYVVHFGLEVSPQL